MKPLFRCCLRHTALRIMLLLQGCLALTLSAQSPPAGSAKDRFLAGPLRGVAEIIFAARRN